MTLSTAVMMSQIGRPANDPQIVDIWLVAEGGSLSSGLRGAVADVTRAQLGQMKALREELLAERLTLY